MLKSNDILDEKNKRLREISLDVIFPLSSNEKKLIKDMQKFLEYSQIEEMAKKYNLRPGMGLAAIQLNIPKRFFVIVEELDNGSFKKYFFANPKIISNSEEMIYAEAGEGCLSVNRDVEGIVPRYARVTVEAYDENGKKFSIRLREEMSIAVQHEIDHLNGILFYDRINKNNPFEGIDKYRAI